MSAASKLLCVSGAYGHWTVIHYMADADLSLMELISLIERDCWTKLQDIVHNVVCNDLQLHIVKSDVMIKLPRKYYPRML